MEGGKMARDLKQEIETKKREIENMNKNLANRIRDYSLSQADLWQQRKKKMILLRKA